MQANEFFQGTDGKVDLDALYAPPSEMIQSAVLDRLIDFHLAYLKAATFFCLSSGSAGGLDASPRGGSPGFVHVLDAHTIAFADWPGNNRIESLRNLERDARLGMLFLFPGLEIFLRINGRGRISTDAALLARLREGERTPKTAVVVAIDQVLAHCGKAANRARLGARVAAGPARAADGRGLPQVADPPAGRRARAGRRAGGAVQRALRPSGTQRLVLRRCPVAVQPAAGTGRAPRWRAPALLARMALKVGRSTGLSR